MDMELQIILMVPSILIVLALESLKKLKLRFEVGEPGEILENDPLHRQPAKWTHVYVYNEPMPRCISWAWDRDPALACHGWITFHYENGDPLFAGKMPIRWANNPEPLIQDPITGIPQGIDWDKMRVGHLWDMPPGSIADGDYGVLDVAFRSHADTDAYGWNNDSYLHHWRNPDWRLPAGRYLVRIAIKSGGQSFRQSFRLLNDGPYETFGQEPFHGKRRPQ